LIVLLFDPAGNESPCTGLIWHQLQDDQVQLSEKFIKYRLSVLQFCYCFVHRCLVWLLWNLKLTQNTIGTSLVEMELTVC